MKIGFDAKRLFHNREGLGSYARTITQDLLSYYPDHDYHLYTPSIGDRQLAHDISDHDSCSVHQPKGFAPMWRSRGIVKDLKRDQVQVYLGLSNELPFGIEKSGIKSVLVLHDMIYKKFPLQYNAIDRAIVHKKVKHAVSVADMIIAPSQHTAKDIEECFPGTTSKTRVIYQSVPPAYRKQESGSNSSKHILCVGTINERKNYHTVIKAMAEIERSVLPKLVIVGEGKQYKQDLVEMIERYDLTDFVTICKDISTDVLVERYRESIALVMPSAYEGFGIPVLEALTLGVPVIISNNTSLPEVAGDHGIVIDYMDHIALANAIKQLSNPNEKSKLLQNLDSHLEKFDSKSISQQYIQLIESIV